MRSADRPTRKDGRTLGRLMASGRLDPREVTCQALEAARDLQVTGAFLDLTVERARCEARLSRQRRRAGATLSPLDGVPVAWKDLIDIAGRVTTAGSRTRLSAPPAGQDATIVSRLAAAGTVCIGKTGLSEFAFSGLGINPHFGTPTLRSPVGEEHIVGGSSSGSALAVALGAVPIAIGTDTSGSVRVPATFAGVTGFKASEHRYPRTGVLSLAPTLDSIGVIATSVADILTIDALLTSSPVSPAGAGSVSLVVPVGELVDDASAPVLRCFHDSLAILASQGVPVLRRELPSLRAAQRLMDEHGTIVDAEAYDRYGHLLASSEPSDVDPGVLRRLAVAAQRVGTLGPVYRAMTRLRGEIAAELDGALLACPAVRLTPPPLGPLLADDARYDRTNRRVLRTTMLLSYLGMPGVTLPVGKPSIGNVGLLLSAPAGHDRRLLHAAVSVEDALTRARAPRHVDGSKAPTPLSLRKVKGKQHSDNSDNSDNGYAR